MTQPQPTTAARPARLALLQREKELTRLSHDLARDRRALPWRPVDADYRFDTPAGPAEYNDRPAGAVCQTYSCYARGLEAFNPAYQLRDLTAKGRDEDASPWTMAWLRRHDEYDA